MEKRIFFVSRRYPPSVGGIETHCYNLYNKLKEKRDVTLVALTFKSLLHLGWFLPYAFLRGVIALLFKRADVIFLTDGVTGALAPLFRIFTNKTIVVTIHGLEMTFKNSIARKLMLNGIKAATTVVPVSTNTGDIIESRGIPSQKLHLIYNGIDPIKIDNEISNQIKNDFEKEHKLTFGKDRVLLNFGRLIERKGVFYFLQKGFHLLDNDIRLIIGGSGPDYNKIEQFITDNNLKNRIILLHRPSDEVVAMLRENADLFLFPNVPMEHDIEGFGMTQLESMYSGTPVVAFAVDALVESVRLGGYLIEPNNYNEFVKTIHDYYTLSDEDRNAKITEAKEYVRREYSWEKTASMFLKVLER